MDNTLGQSPCRVAEFLSYPCFGTLRSVDIDIYLYVLSFLAYTVTPLVNGSQYYTGVSDNACNCNTVMYNLLSACSLCQGGSQEGYDLMALKETLFIDLVLLDGRLLARIAVIHMLGSEWNSTQSKEETRCQCD